MIGASSTVVIEKLKQRKHLLAVTFVQTTDIFGRWANQVPTKTGKP